MGFNTFRVASLIAICMFFILSHSQVTNSLQIKEDLGFSENPQFLDSLRQPDCREINEAKDQCAFYKKYCKDEDDGFISYLSLYYCQLSELKPLAVILCLLWLAELFTALSTVAGDFFAVNIGTIARALNTPDTLAGVTFLALGNGAPDIFSTIAAMNNGSHGMAIGELIGAAAFIASVVAGTMALVEPFPVFKLSLLRDLLFLMLTILFLLYIMIQGKLLLWHCIAMFAFYLVYVTFVMIWHWWLSRRSASKKKHGQAPREDEEDAVVREDETTPLIPQRQSETQCNGQEDLLAAPTPHYRSVPTSSNENGSLTSWCSYMPSRLKHLVGLQGEQGSTQNSQMLPKVPEQTPIYEEHTEANHEDNVLSVASRRIAEQVPRRYREEAISVLSTLFPSLVNIREDHFLRKILNILLIPSTLVLKLTVPVVDGDHQNQVLRAAKQHKKHNEDWERWLFTLQIFTAPQFMLALVYHEAEFDYDRYFVPALSCLGASAVLAALVLLTSHAYQKPRWHKLLVIPGFILSVAWIATIADETVAVFTALGVVGGVSETVLGLTIFAVGNSLDDLAANVSIARHRHPVMALSACFGGPLLNILIGVSISGFMIYGNQMPEIVLSFDNTLYGTVIMVLVTLVVLPLMLIFTNWQMTRPVAFCLIAIWVIGTAVNLGVNISN